MNGNDDVDDWKQKREMKWCTVALRREQKSDCAEDVRVKEK